MSIYCEDTKETVETYCNYLNTIHWSNIKKLMYKKYRYQCSVCGSNYGIQVHHKTYVRIGREELTDLVYMCKACHFLYHDNKALFKNLKMVNVERGNSKQRNESTSINRLTLKTLKEWNDINMEEKKKTKGNRKKKRKDQLEKAEVRTNKYMDSIGIEIVKRE